MPRLSLKKIIFIAIFIRILVILIFLPVKNFDLLAYERIGELTLHGLNIYPYPANLYHPYFPVILYLEALAQFFGKYHILFLKMIFAVFDVGIVYLIYLLNAKIPILNAQSRNLRVKRMSDEAKRGVLLRVNSDSSILLFYVFNPISVFITCIQGQFDSLPLFFLLLSLYFLQTKKIPLSILIFSLAISIKTWPVFFLLPFIRKINNKFLLFLLFIFPLFSLLIYSLVFKSNPITILQTIFWYRAVYGVWGLSLIFKLLNFSASLLLVNRLTIFFTLCFFLFAYLYKRKNIYEEILGSLLFFFIFTPVFGIQWQMWLTPFFLILKIKSKSFYILTTLFIGVSYLAWVGINLGWFTNLLSLASWLTIAGLFYSIRPISSILKVPSAAKAIE